MAAYVQRVIGGLTGDVYGACVELSEARVPALLGRHYTRLTARPDAGDPLHRRLIGNREPGSTEVSPHQRRASFAQLPAASLRFHHA